MEYSATAQVLGAVDLTGVPEAIVARYNELAASASLKNAGPDLFMAKLVELSSNTAKQLQAIRRRGAQGFTDADSERISALSNTVDALLLLVEDRVGLDQLKAKFPSQFTQLQTYLSQVADHVAFMAQWTPEVRKLAQDTFAARQAAIRAGNLDDASVGPGLKTLIASQASGQSREAPWAAQIRAQYGEVSTPMPTTTKGGGGGLVLGIAAAVAAFLALR